MKTPESYICFFNSHKNWGGGEKWHYETSMLLAEQGYRILLFSNKNGSLYKKAQQGSFMLKPVRIKNLSFLNPLKILYIAYALRRYKVNTIIIALPSDVKVAGIAAKLAGVEKIIYRRGTALAVKNSWLNRILFRKVVTDIIANSREIKKRILQKNPHIIGTQKIHVIHNGLIFNGKFPSIFDNKVPGKNKKIIMGNVGRMVEQKGQFMLIQLAQLLKREKIPFEIRIAGEGPLRNKLDRLVAKANLKDQVVFFNFVEDIYQFLSEIDIFLLPSLHEGSSNVLLEAMAMQKPTVAFRISSMPEIITPYKTGMLANFMDVEDYYARVIELINNPALCREIGRNAQQLVKERFDQYIQAEKVIKLIKDESIN